MLSGCSLVEPKGEVGDHACKDCRHTGRLKKKKVGNEWWRKWTPGKGIPFFFFFFFSFGIVRLIFALRFSVLELIV